MTYKQEVRKKVNALSRESKQQILDLVHKGLCIGDIKKQLNLENHIIGRVVLDNIKSIKYLSKEVK